MMDYASFVSHKLTASPPTGIPIDELPSVGLFPHQTDLTLWALRRGRCAIFADTGLGKSRIQVEWADTVCKKQGVDALILAPLAVAEQTVDEGEAIGVSITHCRDGADVQPGVNITNYERLHRFDPDRFGAVVLDECFPRGTLIDTPSGLRSIEDIRPGDEILNASGIDRVSDTHRREVPHAVKVKCADRPPIITSPHHPFFTQRGWVGAQGLKSGDAILQTNAAMRMVRDGVPSSVLPDQWDKQVLRAILLGEMADEYAGAQGKSPYASDIREDSRRQQSMAQFGSSVSHQGARAHSAVESDHEAGNARQDFALSTTHESWPTSARRQWQGSDDTASVHAQRTRFGLGHGVCAVTGSAHTGLPDALQARPGAPCDEDRNRDRRKFSLRAKSEGRKEGCDADFVGLDGIEILESGHPELERYREASGKLYFHDLGATRHPSFSVNGLLVHNSSCIKHQDSKTFALLLDAFQATPFKLCATATPAPNDWTELGTHAEFLGVRSQVEMLAEFFVHDGGETQKWRLKGHARNEFWRWVASWGALVRSPADLGHDASAYDLPPLMLYEHQVESEVSLGQLFPVEAQTLNERRLARRESIGDRVKACVTAIKLEDAGLTNPIIGSARHVETRVHGEQKEEGSAESSVTGEAFGRRKSMARTEQGIVNSLPSGVLRQQSGEVQAVQGGRTRGEESTAKGEVQDGRRSPGEDEKGITRLASCESGQAEASTSIVSIRDELDRLPESYGDAAGQVCDLRLLGPVKQELLPAGGSLPCDETRSGPALHELQSGLGEIQGRPESNAGGDRLPLQKWLIWCDLNDEQDNLERLLTASGISFVSIRGSTNLDHRVEMEKSWRLGSVRVMVSKPSVFGWGMNWQQCARMAFVGVTDSFEAYYQAVRRCWRFGQKRPVHVHIFASEAEGAVVANLKRKEAEAKLMAESLSAETLAAVQANVLGSVRESNIYQPQTRITIPNWMHA